MPILTLTTDWGTGDHYAAALKGCVLQLCPDVRVVDITHQVEKYDAQAAAFTLGAVYRDFPPGTIHFVGVECRATAAQPLVVAAAEGHFFIWVNNGYLSLLSRRFDRVVGVQTTPVRSADVARIVRQLAQSNDLGGLGDDIRVKELLAKTPTVQPNGMVGQILHFDGYGNAITNIARSMFDEVARGRGCTVYINSMAYKVPQLYDTYTDVENGNPVAFFNEQNLLEVACCRGNARKLYRLSKEQSSIMIKFF